MLHSKLVGAASESIPKETESLFGKVLVKFVPWKNEWFFGVHNFFPKYSPKALWKQMKPSW